MCICSLYYNLVIFVACTIILQYNLVLVAARVAAKERLSFMGQHLLVELKTDFHGSMHGRQLGKMNEVKNEENLKLEVTGILENTPREFLSLFFESPKQCDGGPIEDMEFDSDTGTALIAFKDKESKCDSFTIIEYLN